MMAINEAIVDVIHAAAIGLTKGTNLFYGPTRPKSDNVPAKAVFVDTTGGPEPYVYADGGSGTNLNVPTVQILVRGKADDWSDGNDLATAVYAVVRKCTPSGSIGVLAEQSAPLPLGQDEQGRWIWSINLRAYVRE